MTLSEPLILLLPPPKSWEYRLAPSHTSGYSALEKEPGGFVYGQQALYQMTYIPILYSLEQVGCYISVRAQEDA